MEIRPADPRNGQWEVDARSYRVYFWERPADPQRMLGCEEVRVTDVDDVQEVLDWAAGYAGDRDAVVYLELTSGPRVSARRPGLIRISGRDPNA